MKKKFTSKLLKIWQNPITKIIIYLGVLILIFALSGAFDKEGDGLIAFVISVLTKDETVSFFSAGIFTVILAIIIKSSEKRLEESLKIEDNHHKIIAQYKGHEKNKISVGANYYDKNGIFMELHHTKKLKKPIKNPIKDIYSDEYASLNEELELYNKRGVLLLPTVNVYTNILGTSIINFDDKADLKELPQFVIGNGVDFMSAHKYSQTSNNITIRLDDISVNGNNVTFYTSRSYYYHMLLTNRCMDYKIKNGMSIRGLYEFNNKISLLKDSKLSNQIGINGMIMTKDGYLLLEKRDRKKTTWKNKFAQPISLALKASDLKLSSSDVMDNSVDYANQKLLGVIKKTMKGNFGLKENDYEVLSLEKNFLGLARDLLEGGKPNFYFNVTVNYTSKEFAKLLKENASKDDPAVALKKGKLSSKYYLVNYEDIEIDFNYSLRLKQKNIIKVNRIVYPRCSKAAERFDNFKYKLSKSFNKYIKYDCGEALLVTLSYLEVCHDRLDAIKEKKL